MRRDFRWRKTTQVSLDVDVVSYFEGESGNFLIVESQDTSTVSCSVRSIADPVHAVASGAFDGSDWAFSGESQAWATVPEYLMIPGDGKRRHLLRIADGAKPDPLEHLGVIDAVCPVPHSRLVVLSGEAHLTVWDPVGRRAGAHLRLVAGTELPEMRFRNTGSELWVNDGSSLLKLETKNWEIVDAAGFGDEPGSDQEPREVVPSIVRWVFDEAQQTCGVIQAGEPRILLIDAASMLPLETLQFAFQPADVLVRGRRVDVISREGEFQKARL